MYWEYSALPAVSRLHQHMEKWGGLAEFIAAIPAIRPKNAAFWEAIHTVMQCMAYGANPAAPLGFDPPVDPTTGALIPEVWERWLHFDPVRMLDRPDYQAALRRMRVIFLEAGRFDEYQLQVGARIFHQKLTALGINHHYEEFPDGHGDTSYRYDVALPVLSRVLSE
jgi:enterochelin esterase family protein